MTSYTQARGQLGAAVRALVVLTVILGVGYPLAVTAVAQVGFQDKADGSLLERDGVTIGSSLIGQAFTRPVLRSAAADSGAAVLDDAGLPVVEPDPAYFQSRPSAAGAGYDPLSSSASNLGPNNADLLSLVEQRRATVAELDGVEESDVAPDALLASGSGLDPHISPAYADQQVARVAAERGLDPARVAGLVEANTQGRILGFLGEPVVNVLAVNLALDDLTD